MRLNARRNGKSGGIFEDLVVAKNATTPTTELFSVVRQEDKHQVQRNLPVAFVLLVAESQPEQKRVDDPLSGTFYFVEGVIIVGFW